MSVRIRLQRRGSHKKPFFHIVVADSRSPRDGRFIEKIGTYNPLKGPVRMTIRSDLYAGWIAKGAQPSAAVAALVRNHKQQDVEVQAAGEP